MCLSIVKVDAFGYPSITPTSSKQRQGNPIDGGDSSSVQDELRDVT